MKWQSWNGKRRLLMNMKKKQESAECCMAKFSNYLLKNQEATKGADVLRVVKGQLKEMCSCERNEKIVDIIEFTLKFL